MVAVGINCFGARLYGNVEFWFAMVRMVFVLVDQPLTNIAAQGKIITIVLLSEMPSLIQHGF